MTDAELTAWAQAHLLSAYKNRRGIWVTPLIDAHRLHTIATNAFIDVLNTIDAHLWEMDHEDHNSAARTRNLVSDLIESHLKTLQPKE